MVSNHKSKKKHINTIPNPLIGPFYLKMPFIDDATNRKLRKLFLNEGLDIRLAQRTTTLRSILQYKNNDASCSRKHCVMQAVGCCNFCLKRSVVYQINCGNCRKTYIGSTIRYLHDRVREHLTSTYSSVYKHLFTCQDGERNISVDILRFVSDPVDLRIAEAILIKTHKPSMNSKEEISELDYIFL